MVTFKNGAITMPMITFYISLTVALLSLASGAYGLSRVYTDSKVETVNTRIHAVEQASERQRQHFDEKFCDIKEILCEIKEELKELRRK